MNSKLHTNFRQRKLKGILSQVPFYVPKKGEEEWIMSKN